MPHESGSLMPGSDAGLVLPSAAPAGTIMTPWLPCTATANLCRMTLAHHRPAHLADALDRLSDPSRLPIGGGMDLLEAIAEGLAAPSEVVEVAGLAELLGVTELPDGGVRIG